MTPKIQKIAGDIERTRERLKETQDRLRELERQKTELENTEIVALFRSLNVATDALPDFIAAMKQAPALPVTASPASAEARDTSPAPYTSGYSRNQEDENEE